MSYCIKILSLWSRYVLCTLFSQNESSGLAWKLQKGSVTCTGMPLLALWPSYYHPDERLLVTSLQMIFRKHVWTLKFYCCFWDQTQGLAELTWFSQRSNVHFGLCKWKIIQNNTNQLNNSWSNSIVMYLSGFHMTTSSLLPYILAYLGDPKVWRRSSYTSKNTFFQKSNFLNFGESILLTSVLFL